MSDKIPVVFSTDDLFTVPAYTAIWSMLKNASIYYFYDIYIMHSGDLSVKNRDFLSCIENEYKNCRLSFLYVDDSQFKYVSLKEEITVSAMFRLLVSRYLKQYDKCLYIDCDVIVLGDISELYAVDMEDSYIAAVKDSGVQYFFEENCAYAKRIGIDDMRDYINSGVLVMNMSAIRNDGLIEQFMSCVGNTYLYADQDILNRCCQHKIHYLPLKYNLFRRFYGKTDLLRDSDFGEKEIKEAAETPVILHYAEGSKPWRNRKGTGSGVWWEYAKEALPRAVYQSCRQQAEEYVRQENWEKAAKRALQHKSVIIFGYSCYGKEALKILQNLGVDHITAFCDNNLEKQGQVYEGIKVKSLQEIKTEYEDVFFINSSQRQRTAVIELLEESGYDREMIWNYDHYSYIHPRERMYYAILDKRYYISELRNIVRLELGICSGDWDELCDIVARAENKAIADKYYMNEWALNVDLV